MSALEIYKVVEFHGDGDPMFGGEAADWPLVRKPDGTLEFMPGMATLRDGHSRAYFADRDAAQAAGESASVRGGSVMALAAAVDPKIPLSEIRRFVCSLHVGTSGNAVVAEIEARLKASLDKAQVPDHIGREILSQAGAYALACHEANVGLVTAFRL